MNEHQVVNDSFKMPHKFYSTGKQMIEFSWIIFPIEQKHFNLIYVWKLQRLDLWHCRPLSNTEPFSL